MNHSRPEPSSLLCRVGLLCALIGSSFSATAAEFAALISPPRFELKAKPGESLTQLVDISNDSAAIAQYQIRSADWSLNAEGGAVIHPEQLQPGSCRPWVRIERRTLKLAPQATKKYRFEVSVPADAPAGECRFALLIEPTPDDAPLVSAGNIKFPVQGRIAVIVYVVVGDASPRLELRNIGLEQINGRTTPVASFHNAGSAHGRPEGVLAGTDANGQKLDFTVASLPILPNETRVVPIWPQEDPASQSPGDYSLPLQLKGRIEWDGGEYELDTTLENASTPHSLSTPAPVPASTPAVATAEPVAPAPVEPAQPAEVAVPVAPDPQPAETTQAATVPADTANLATTGWVVQLATMSIEQNALTLRDKLLAQGYTAFVEPVEGARGKTYRVRVGPEPERSAADALRDKLENEFKLEGIVARQPS